MDMLLLFTTCAQAGNCIRLSEPGQAAVLRQFPFMHQPAAISAVVHLLATISLTCPTQSRCYTKCGDIVQRMC